MLSNLGIKSSQKPRRKRGNPRQRARQSNAVGQQAGPNYNFAVQPGPYLAPRMPKEFSVSLNVQSDVVVSAATGDAFQNYYLFEFQSKRPLYMKEFYAMYKFCRVTAAHVRLDICNTGLAALNCSLGVVPFQDIAALTVDKLVEKDGTIRKLVSAQGGMDRIVLEKTFPAQQWLGNAILDRQWWVDETQSTSATVIDPTEPVAVFGYRAIQAAMYSMSYTYKVTYHLQWFDLEVPTPS